MCEKEKRRWLTFLPLRLRFLLRSFTGHYRIVIRNAGGEKGISGRKMFLSVRGFVRIHIYIYISILNVFSCYQLWKNNVLSNIYIGVKKINVLYQNTWKKKLILLVAVQLQRIPTNSSQPLCVGHPKFLSEFSWDLFFLNNVRCRPCAKQLLIIFFPLLHFRNFLLSLGIF